MLIQNMLEQAKREAVSYWKLNLSMAVTAVLWLDEVLTQCPSLLVTQFYDAVSVQGMQSISYTWQNLDDLP